MQMFRMSNAPTTVICKECVRLYMLVRPIVPTRAPVTLNAAEKMMPQPPTPPLIYDTFKIDI